MDDQLLAILHALAEPGATLRVCDFSVFGFLLPVCGVEGAYDNPPVDYADVMTMEAAGYIAIIERPRTWKTVYQVTVGGILAITEAEKEIEHEQTQPNET